LALPANEQGKIKHSLAIRGMKRMKRDKNERKGKPLLALQMLIYLVWLYRNTIFKLTLT